MNIKIIDNFLKDQDFSDLCSLNINTVERDKVKVYHNSVYNIISLYSNNILDQWVE